MKKLSTKQAQRIVKLIKPRFYVIPADEHQSLICIGPCKLKSDARKLMRQAKLSPEKWKVVKLMECTETLTTSLLGDKA